MKSFRFGIRLKFVALVLLLLVAVVGFFANYLLQSGVAEQRRNLKEQAISFAELATKPIGDSYLVYGRSGHARLVQQMQRFTDLSPVITNVTVTDLEGTGLIALKQGEEAAITPEEAETFETIVQYGDDGTVTRIIAPYIEDFGAHRYTLVYDVSNERIQETIARTVSSAIFISAIAFIMASALFFFVFDRFILSPLKSVSDSANRISNGDLEEQVSVNRNDELGDLAASVSQMATTLKADIRKLREVDRMKSEFMVVASHNLRTPLAVITGYLDILGNMQLDEKVHQTVQYMTVSARQLQVLSEDLLTISSIEAGERVLQKKPLRIKELIDGTVQDLRPAAEQKGVKLIGQYSLTDEVVMASRSHVYSALWNVMENAVKFTEPGKLVTVSARSNGESAIIEVADEGIGIKKEEIPRLFTKFHRGTSSLEYDYEGVGIGLYVTKLVIDDHGGSIEVKSEEQVGTAVTITLPLVKPEAQNGESPAAAS